MLKWEGRDQSTNHRQYSSKARLPHGYRIGHSSTSFLCRIEFSNKFSVTKLSTFLIRAWGEFLWIISNLCRDLIYIVCYITRLTSPIAAKWRIYFTNLSQHWSDDGLSPSHYRHQCCIILISTFRNKLQSNCVQNSNMFIQENAFENVVSKILSQ